MKVKRTKSKSEKKPKKKSRDEPKKSKREHRHKSKKSKKSKKRDHSSDSSSSSQPHQSKRARRDSGSESSTEEESSPKPIMPPQQVTPTKLKSSDLQYVEGDATVPRGDGNKIVAHICNTAGGWGRGFVLALSKKWHLPEQKYRSLPTPIDLGNVQFVEVTDDIVVANMVAQTAPQSNGPPPIQYEGLRKALKQVAEHALKNNASVHMPKIGSGLSRGNWDKISVIIKEELSDCGIPAFVYVFDDFRRTSAVTPTQRYFTSGETSSTTMRTPVQRYFNSGKSASATTSSSTGTPRVRRDFSYSTSKLPK